MKVCKICKIEKEESEFYPTYAKCKKCKNEGRKEYRKQYYELNIEKSKKQIHEYYLRTKEKTLERTRKWRQDNPEKFTESHKKSSVKFPFKRPARRILNYYLEKGDVTRPDNCSSCGINCKPDAHHENYSKPLEVKWLCKLCHGILHRKIK